MLSMAHGEFIYIVRNRAVLIVSLIVSFAAAVCLIYFRGTYERFGSLGYIGAGIVFTIAAFSLYATMVVMLAARRKGLFVKRQRSTVAGGGSILWGLIPLVSVLSLLQAGVTNATEQAQVTVLHIGLGIFIIVNWVAIAGTESLVWMKRLLPGAAAAELTVEAWHSGISFADSLLVLAPTLVWIIVAIALASRLFRWEARR
jgi:ABC-2 type transport system permease protein